MARSPIPMTMQEWPEYEYRPWPKQIGLDADGNAIDVQNEEEAEARRGEVVYPKTLGKDKDGKPLVASHPSQEPWMNKLVVAEKVAEAEAKAAPAASATAPTAKPGKIGKAA